MPAEPEAGFDDRVRLPEGALDLAGIEAALERKIVAELGMDDGRRRVERGLRIRHRRERLVFDAGECGRVLGERAAPGHDRRNGFALPARPLDRDRMLRRGFQPLQMRQHADPRRAYGRELRAGHDRNDARRAPRGRGVDRTHAGMGVRRAYEGHMRHTRQHEIADELAAALQQTRQIRPRHRTADVGIRPIERGQAAGLFVHECSPAMLLDPFPGGILALARATDSIASTIA
jgi:hypothetical protein